MIPFPGESLRLDYAADLTGGADFTLYTDIAYRAGSRTLTAGGEWRVWEYPGETTYLEDAGEDVTVSWVVEVNSGTATLTAAWGFDATYEDTAAATPNGLGTHTVTGPATLVLDTTLTAADVLSHPDSFTLSLACTSGAVDVAQVKLRVWPAAGVAGGWSDTMPSFTGPVTTAGGYTHSAAINVDPHLDADPDAAWDASVADFHDQTDALAVVEPRPVVPHTTISDAYIFHGRSIYVAEVDPVVWGAQQGASSLAFVFKGLDWADQYPIASTLTEDVDYIRPPDEVDGDYARYAQQLGPGSTTWVRAQVSLYTAAAEGPGGPSVVAEGGVFTPDPLTDELDFGYQYGPNVGVGTFEDPVVVPLPTTDRDIFVCVTHSAAVGDRDDYTVEEASGYAFGYQESLFNFTWGTDEGPPATYVTLPPYRVWTPTATKQHPHLIFQRSDGLGAGAKLIYKQDTRQSTGTVYSNY